MKKNSIKRIETKMPLQALNATTYQYLNDYEDENSAMRVRGQHETRIGGDAHLYRLTHSFLGEFGEIELCSTANGSVATIKEAEFPPDSPGMIHYFLSSLSNEYPKEVKSFLVDEFRTNQLPQPKLEAGLYEIRFVIREPSRVEREATKAVERAQVELHRERCNCLKQFSSSYTEFLASLDVASTPSVPASSSSVNITDSIVTINNGDMIGGNKRETKASLETYDPSTIE